MRFVLRIPLVVGGIAFVVFGCLAAFAGLLLSVINELVNGVTQAVLFSAAYLLERGISAIEFIRRVPPNSEAEGE